MKNYNDFQILNDDQYQAMQREYEKQTLSPSSQIYHIFTKLHICINSCSLINTNYKLSTTLIESKNNLMDILSSLQILYPSINTTTHESTTNIFSLISHLFETHLIFAQINQKEKRRYYFHTQEKLSLKISNVIKNILNTLSTLNITFYKFM